MGTELIGESKDVQLVDFAAFERMLSEISATYINLPIAELEEVLKKDFARLTMMLGVDASLLLIRDDEDPHLFRSMRPYVWFLDEDDKANAPLLDWIKQNSHYTIENSQYSFGKYNEGQCVAWNRIDEIPKEARELRVAALRNCAKSALSVPVSFAGRITGVIVVQTTHTHRTWHEDLTNRLRLFGEVFINALMRKQSEEKLQKAFSEIQQLKDQLEADYLYLKKEIKEENDFEGIVGKSESLKKTFLKIKKVSPTNTTVLILGETGTGKGLVARAIHDASIYRNRPMIQVNCAALAPSLIESELFGHEKGAFTGAVMRRLGRFETAKGTTLFLDEIGDLPMELQPKLLRVLEEGEFERVGASTSIKTNVRIIAATSRNLEWEVEEGRFRRDLWYRLSLFPIIIPPLRERIEDISLFVAYFIDKYGNREGKKFKPIPIEVIRALQAYSWPGNIRELRNVIERALITASDGVLRIKIPKQQPFSLKEMKPLKEIEREAIIRVLEKTNWKIYGCDGAARYLDINPDTLRFRMRKLNIKRSNKVAPMT
jgi:formate hydrogenlyase transcriptional activator